MKYSLLHPFQRLPEQQLELFDTPEKISMKVFYKILETNDLKLLANNPSLLKEKDGETLNDVWLSLLDFYYRNTNKQSWENFLRNLKAVTKIQNELTGCRAAYEMCLLGDERGFENLKKFGIQSENLDAVRSQILSKETKLDFAERKLKKKDEGEAFNMYRMLANLRISNSITVDIEKVCLAEWVEILKGISERNKAEREAYNKSKIKNAR